MKAQRWWEEITPTTPRETPSEGTNRSGKGQNGGKWLHPTRSASPLAMGKKDYYFISRDDPSCDVGSNQSSISTNEPGKSKSPPGLVNISVMSNGRSGIDTACAGGAGADAVGGRWGFIDWALLRSAPGVGADPPGFMSPSSFFTGPFMPAWPGGSMEPGPPMPFGGCDCCCDGCCGPSCPGSRPPIGGWPRM